MVGVHGLGLRVYPPSPVHLRAATFFGKPDARKGGGRYFLVGGGCYLRYVPSSALIQGYLHSYIKYLRAAVSRRVRV